jgi:hypothetical protein
MVLGTMLLERYEKEGEAFLKPIVTGMKSGFTIFNQRVNGKSSTGSTFRLQKRRSQRLNHRRGKSCLRCLGLRTAYTWTQPDERWNSKQWTLLCPSNRRTEAGYLREARWPLSPTIIQQHDNARPHTANKTLNTIRYLKLELLEHPPPSTHLAPSDFHMFGLSKCD